MNEPGSGGGWGAEGPKAVASYTPAHGSTGLGARDRSPPTRAPAYRIPRYRTYPSQSTPSILPRGVMIVDIARVSHDTPAKSDQTAERTEVPPGGRVRRPRR